MPLHEHPLKLALKRGALVAAANWPVTVAQAAADSLFKILIAAPLVGGIFLVALVVGAEPVALLSLGWRDLAMTIVASLMSRPLVLASFVSGLGVAIIGGSLFVFLVKAGTVGVLVHSERDAGPIERQPLHLQLLTTTSRFSTEGFLERARSLFPQYARLGFMLMAVYLASGIVYLGAVFGSRGSGEGLGMTALFTAAFVAWITIVNLLYLLTQIVIAAEDCTLPAAFARVSAFLRRSRVDIGSIFLTILAIVVAATGASVLVTTALGLISFVPFLWLVAVPLQLAAWVLRAIVFQYIGLASIGAYLHVYRTSVESAPSRLNAPAAPFADAIPPSGGLTTP